MNFDHAISDKPREHRQNNLRQRKKCEKREPRRKSGLGWRNCNSNKIQHPHAFARVHGAIRLQQQKPVLGAAMRFSYKNSSHTFAGRTAPKNATYCEFASTTLRKNSKGWSSPNPRPLQYHRFPQKTYRLPLIVSLMDTTRTEHIVG